MSKYDLDLDYVIPMIDISQKDLEEIVAEADGFIAENKETPQKLAMAYLKKAQALHKIYECISAENNGKSPEISRDEIKQQIKALIDKALELSPDMPEAIMQLGKVYHYFEPPYRNFHVEAIKCYTRAIRLKPDYAAAYNYRGNIHGTSFSNWSPNDQRNVFCQKEHSTEEELANENRQENQIADYTEAIRLRPFDASYYFNRGLKYSQMGEHEKAITDYTSVITYGTDKFKKITRIFYQRGKEYFLMNEYEKAQNDFCEYSGNFDELLKFSYISLPPVISFDTGIIDHCFFCRTFVFTDPIGSNGFRICPECLKKLDLNLASVFSITREDIKKCKQKKKNRLKKSKFDLSPKIFTKIIDKNKRIKYTAPGPLFFQRDLASLICFPDPETGIPNDGLANRQVSEDETCFVCKRNCYVTEILFMMRSNLWICPDCIKYIDINDEDVSVLSVSNEEIAECRTYLDSKTPEGKKAHSILKRDGMSFVNRKIISWNCHCGFTEDKVSAIKPYDADILVIPECREMDMETSGYDEKHRYWYGDHKEATDEHGNINKEKDFGIGIFWNEKITIAPLPQWKNTLCKNNDFRYLVPFKARTGYYAKPFTLIAVWNKGDGKLWRKVIPKPAHPVKTEEEFLNTVSLIGPELLDFAKGDDAADPCAAIDHYKNMGLLDDRVVIIGDFGRNTALVEKLKQKGMVNCSAINGKSNHSTYCYCTETGQEQVIADYCFVSSDMAKSAHFSVPDASDWKQENGVKHWNGSDHFPICVELYIDI